ncbi:MAG: TonB-dependent receptor [Candidatus Omnitrophica bacterium]|nr:TonB-dependent receptor [Candidatus Omnitrophota bacterium]
MKIVKFSAVVLSVGILFIGFSTVALAEDIGIDSISLSENNEVALEKIVVTPYRTSVSAKENPSATNVIKVGDEESVGKFSFVDVIKGAQGVDYAVTGGMNGVSSVYIRGADAYHTQLMLDGIKVYDPINTQGYFAYYNYLSLDNLDKVEISRGPFSSLYGSQSIGGSINMITHKGSGKPTFSFLQEFGSYNTYREKVASQGQLGKLAYSLGVSRIDVRSFYSARYKNGNHERDPFGNTNTSLRLDYELSDNFEIGLSHRYSYAKYDYDGGWSLPSDDHDNTARFYQNIGTFYLSNKINDFLSHKFTYGVVDIQRRWWEGPDGFGGDGSYWYRGKSNQFKYSFDYNPSAFYNALIGYEYVGDIGSSFWSPTTEPKHKANSKGIFIQNIFRPIDNLFISFVVRSENHSTFGNNATYGLSSSYFFELTNTKLKASMGTGFRAPSLYELFSAYGNRELSPEKSKSFDVGFEQSFFEGKLNFGSTGFKNHIKDRVESDSLTWIYYNAGDAKIYGLENFIEYKFNDKTSVKLTYDYLHAQNESDKSRLLRRPKNKVGVLFQAEMGRLRIAPEIFYVGSRIDKSGSSYLKLKSYILANLGLNYKINNNLEVFGRVENILNYDYQLVYGYETPKASVYGGVKLSF